MGLQGSQPLLEFLGVVEESSEKLAIMFPGNAKVADALGSPLEKADRASQRRSCFRRLKSAALPDAVPAREGSLKGLATETGTPSPSL